ncbi:hypothetical protein YO5_01936 [Stutzerimonas stutzeri TS44]|nr:hypothetical protein YO5_01936 [Stutzerimonas stutzeri TS44]
MLMVAGLLSWFLAWVFIRSIVRPLSQAVPASNPRTCTTLEVRRPPAPRWTLSSRRSAGSASAIW